MSKEEVDPNANEPAREMTVAHIRKGTEVGSIEVMFLQSARIYRLLNNHPSFGKVLGRLRDGLARGQNVRVTIAGGDSDLIEDVS